MSIRNRNFTRHSVVRGLARNLLLYVPPNASGSTYIVNAATSTSMTVATALTLSVTLTVAPHSLIFTPGGAPASPFTFTIIGENQFGETVTESVTISTATAISSLWCYRKLTSITPTAKSSTGGDTMSIGWATAVAGLPRIAFPCKFVSTGSVKQVVFVGNYGTQPAFTVIGDPYYALTWATNVPASNPFGVVICQMDEEDGTI